MRPTYCRSIPTSGRLGSTKKLSGLVRPRARHVLPLAMLALLVPTICCAQVGIEAYVGDRWGIGRVTIELPRNGDAAPIGDDRFAIADSGGRILYPVIEHRDIGGDVNRIVGQFIDLEIRLPNRVRFYFLFRGEAPLDLTVYTPGPLRADIRPVHDERRAAELFADWWRARERHFQQVHHAAEYPIVVENYLTANWARRLGRDVPEPGLQVFRQRRIGGSWVAQLTANEAYQASIERDLVLGRFDGDAQAVVRLPDPPLSQPLELATTADAKIEVEPIASHVPHECFYVRFGDFTNYLWFRDFLRLWQGDLTNMIALRSINRDASQRLQEQIAMRETRIARVMGPQVIRDVAMLGFDFYLRDGAAFGILFHANSSLLLGRNIREQRADAVGRYDDATDETIAIAGHDVSYLSTPDGRLRSYYAVDGDFHLVATSRRLVERFYEAGAGQGALAGAADFRAARADLPLARNDTLFLYLSPAFFENLAGPQYRVELDRRLRSLSEMRTLTLARLAAQSEGFEADSVDELIAADLLPRGFSSRADGSELVESDAGFRDSLRGVPGWFVPVADVPVDQVTAVEARRYQATQRTIQAEVGRFVPVAAAIERRTSDDGEIDRIAASVRLAPYSQTRLAQWADRLGPAESLRVAPIAGDVIGAEAVWSVLGQPIHLFGGLRDYRAPLVVREGRMESADWPAQFARAYVGTWPRPLALLDAFLSAPVGPIDGDGIARRRALRGAGRFDLWQRRLDDFLLFAFQRDVLLEVGPQLVMVEPESAAQVRLWIDDLSGKQLASAVNGLGYMQTRATSASASRFMNSLTTQLHVPPEDTRAVAEQLVGGTFDCPLGGEYELVDPLAREADALPTPDGRRLWISTAATPENRFLLTEIPAEYTMPLLEWFRGLSLEVARLDTADALALYAELDMVHQEVAPPTENGEGGGFFQNLFGGWGSSGDEESEEPEEELPAPNE